MKSDESQSVDDEPMRLTISLLPQTGVLGVWLTTAGVCAYVCQRLRLAYSRSKKRNQASASPFLVAISDLTAYLLLVSNNMVRENINSVVPLANPVFHLGAATASSLRPAIDSVKLTNVNRFLPNHSGKTLEGDGKKVYTLGAPIMGSPVVPHLALPDWEDQIRWMASSAFSGRADGTYISPQPGAGSAIRDCHMLRVGHDWNVSGATSTHDFFEGASHCLTLYSLCSVPLGHRPGLRAWQ